MLKANLPYIANTNNFYWLEDTIEKNGFTVRHFRSSDNKLSENNKTYSEKSKGGYNYFGSTLNFGSYGICDYEQLDSFEIPDNTYVFNNNKDFEVAFYGYQLGYPELQYGAIVFNNPMLIDDPSSGYYSTTIIEDLHISSVLAKVEGGNGSYFVSKINLGDKCFAGEVLACSISRGLTSTKGFVKNSENLYNVYFRAQNNYLFYNRSSYSEVISGLTQKENSEQVVNGDLVEPDSFHVRALFDVNKENIAFIRKRSESSPETSSVFKALPTFTAFSGSESKLVVISARPQIENHLESSKLSTNLSIDNHCSTTYSNYAIHIPFNSRTLTIDASAFSFQNSNYVCALSENAGIKKFVVFGNTSENINIDLDSVINTSALGSSAKISFYAMQINGENYSDAVSSSPVTVSLEVVEGPVQTITYDVASGDGSVTAQIFRAGQTVPIADGSSLHLDDNSFSGWVLSYTLFGETVPVTKFLRSSEIFTVPDTTNGKIQAVANYSGVIASKSTETKSSVYTITWDTNSPENGLATFTGTGDFNSSKTQRYDKIKVLNAPVVVPGAPTISISTYKFDGWFTSATGGTKVEGSVNVNSNTIYYAHWVNECIITFSANGGSFSDGDEKVATARIGYSLADNGQWVSETPTWSGNIFAGWYLSDDGGDERFTETSIVSGAVKVYAYWLPEVFMAKASFDPAKLIAGTNAQTTRIIATSEVLAASSALLNGEVNPNPEIFNSTNDEYHLFMKVTGTTGALGNHWNEFRIIQTGEHDGDGTGLTFQMTHAWSGISSDDTMIVNGMFSEYYWSEGKRATSWNSSYLKSILNMNVNLFMPSSFSGNLVLRTLKNNMTPGFLPNGGAAETSSDRLAPLSFTELVSNASAKTKYIDDNGTEVKVWDDDTHSGSTYQFWADKDLQVESKVSADSAQAKLLKAMCSDREGNLLRDDTLDYGFVWLRSVSPGNREKHLTFTSEGYIFGSDGPTPKNYGCIVPAFGLG